jgi:methylenetetrahydrofolate dehydrogenase (NADP+)/methenyltetrahydrofolate cyclohydrolase
LSARILSGLAVRDQIYAELRRELDELLQAGHQPGLAAVLVGDHPPSRLYVRNKMAACQQLGILSELHELPADASTATLLDLVGELNARDDIDGILVQLPLPQQIETGRILEAIDPVKDVDGFHPLNLGRLLEGRPEVVACTPAGVMELLRRYHISVAGLHAVVVGRSTIVGKPMALLLLQANATVTVCHSKTRDLAAITRQADLVVVAAGRPALLGPDDIQPGAIVVDVGINTITDAEEAARLFARYPQRLTEYRARGRTLVGDVHPDVAEVAGALTPVPGGVGPLTVAMLMVNTVRAARRRRLGSLRPVGSPS